MFDIAQLDIATGSDEGRQMQVRHPKGGVVTDSEGKPVTITLLGFYSKRFREKDREITQRRIEQARLGIQPSPEDAERDAVERLAAVTVAWSFDTLDGQPFPCTEENAKRFWSDRRFAAIRAQADQFIANDGNFTRG